MTAASHAPYSGDLPNSLLSLDFGQLNLSEKHDTSSSRGSASGSDVASPPPRSPLAPSSPSFREGARAFARPQTPPKAHSSRVIQSDAIEMETRPTYAPSIYARSVRSMSHGAGKDRSALFALMTKPLYMKAYERHWFSTDPETASGVAVHRGRGQYTVYPEDGSLDTFSAGLSGLHPNPRVAFILSSPEVVAIASYLEPGLRKVQITPDEAIQIVETMEELHTAQYAHMACFIRLEGKLVVWCNSVEEFLPTGEAFHSKLMRFVWSQTVAAPQFGNDTATAGDQTPGSTLFPDGKDWEDSNVNLAADTPERKTAPRPMRLNAAIYTGLSVGLDIFLCCSFIILPVRQSLLDGHYMRCLLVVVLPILFLILLFVCENVITVIMQCLAPIDRMHENSLYYSGKPPNRIRSDLPHITVMMPVYKESLKDVLAPSINSLKQAIMTYERQGGTANILVCEDGLQVVDERERSSRQAFYEQNGCAYVARAPENRAGRFKKSSNLNVAHNLSLRVEEIIAQHRPRDEESLETWSQADETRLEEMALIGAIDETQGKVWAVGNIRIGDYILLVDSDTRIPADCFIDAASEMEESPEVAILQHSSGTFLAGAGYFENGMAFFIKIINFQLSWSCANGQVSPFMGHNAFLRWSALQNVSTEVDGKRMFWSEEHVSEDFILQLQLVTAGYITRWVTYSNNLFQEGVSLYAEDELNRWQKYAWGCSELVFWPMKYWFTRSPFTKTIRSYLWAPVPLSAKFQTLAYIFSYWSIAAACPVALAMYPVLIFFTDVINASYTRATAYNIFLTITFIFTIGTMVALIVSRWRSRDSGFVQALVDHLSWAGFMFIFFNGLSWHVFVALVAHISGYNMSWSSTVKDLQTSTVTTELPKIAKRWWAMYILFILYIAGVIVTTTPLLPVQYRIDGYETLFPFLLVAVGTILYPLALSPAITSFRF